MVVSAPVDQRFCVTVVLGAFQHEVFFIFNYIACQAKAIFYWDGRSVIPTNLYHKLV